MPRGQLWQVAHDRALLDTVEDPTRGWDWINAGNRPPALVGRTNDALHKRFTRLTAAQTRAARAYVPPIPAIGAPNIDVVVTAQATAPAPATLPPSIATSSSVQHAITPAINAHAGANDGRNAAVDDELAAEEDNLAAEDDELTADSGDAPADDEATETTPLRGRKRTRQARSEEGDRDSSASNARNVRRKLSARGAPPNISDDDAEGAATQESADEPDESQNDIEGQQAENDGQQSESEQAASDWDIEGPGPTIQYMRPHRYTQSGTGIRNVGDLMRQPTQVIARHQYSESLVNLRPITQRAFDSDLEAMSASSTTQGLRAPAAELAGGYHFSTPSTTVANRDNTWDTHPAVYADHQGNVEYDDQSVDSLTSTLAMTRTGEWIAQ